MQNHINLKRNEQALKTSKDISVANTMNKKAIFDMINAEEEELTTQGGELNRLVFEGEKQTERNAEYKSRNNYKEDLLSVQTAINTNLKTTASTAGGLYSARADNTISSYRT